jgi:membrane associated rhomboid family serine protease
MVDRFRRTSIGLKLLSALLAFGFIVRLVVVLLSVNHNGVADIEAFDSYVGFSTKSESMTWLWTWLTYSFFHAEVSHFIWNYILLILLIYWSKERFFGLNVWRYWFAGILGGLVFLYIDNHEFSLIGASSGITSLWVAWLIRGLTNRNIRDASFWLGCGVFLFLEIVDVANYESHDLSLLAHLGGAFGGIVMTALDKLEWTSMKWIEKIFSLFKPSPKLTVKRSNKRFQTDDEFNSERKLREDFLNSILDKISRSGFESLSSKEKEFLEQHKEK